jgi:hypothetical protein
LVRFFFVEPIYLDSNFKFGLSIVYLGLIIFLVVCDVLIDSETFLVIDFINIKIKSIQFFEDANMGKILICV